MFRLTARLREIAADQNKAAKTARRNISFACLLWMQPLDFLNWSRRATPPCTPGLLFFKLRNFFEQSLHCAVLYAGAQQPKGESQWVTKTRAKKASSRASKVKAAKAWDKDRTSPVSSQGKRARASKDKRISSPAKSRAARPDNPDKVVRADKAATRTAKL